MTKEFLIFDRAGGGKLLLPVDELGVVSTLTTNVGTAEAPVIEMDDTKSFVRIKCLGADIAVCHPIEQIAEWIEQVVNR